MTTTFSRAEVRLAAKGFGSNRMVREWKAMEVMIYLSCHGHKDSTPCRECRQLLDYAKLRLESCRFGSEKPVCATCLFQCYESTRREQLQAVICRAGPRMTWRYPWLSVRYWLDGLRRAPSGAMQMDCSSWGTE